MTRGDGWLPEEPDHAARAHADLDALRKLRRQLADHCKRIAGFHDSPHCERFTSGLHEAPGDVVHEIPGSDTCHCKRHASYMPDDIVCEIVDWEDGR